MACSLEKLKFVAEANSGGDVLVSTVGVQANVQIEKATLTKHNIGGEAQAIPNILIVSLGFVTDDIGFKVDRSVHSSSLFSTNEIIDGSSEKEKTREIHFQTGAVICTCSIKGSTSMEGE